MCGRFTLKTPAKQVAELFGVLDTPPLEHRYNVAPSQIAVVGLKPDGRRGLAMLARGWYPTGPRARATGRARSTCGPRRCGTSSRTCSGGAGA